jgi:hypothetical protein
MKDMKKLLVEMAFLLSLFVALPRAQAQTGGGLFGRGQISEGTETVTETQGPIIDSRSGTLIPTLPSAHGLTTNEVAPLGSGVLTLFGMALAYFVFRQKKANMKNTVE